MPRRTPLLALPLLLAGFAAAPPPEEELRCQAFGTYTGNFINPTYSLTIAGPPARTWAYRWTDDHFGLTARPDVWEIQGTYEAAGGLAVFTGAGKYRGEAREVRFGVNHATVGKEVHFDRLFPWGDTFTYRRQVYARSGKGWRLAEERVLSAPGKALVAGADRWTMPVTGRRTVWDAEGGKTVERAAEEIVYRKGDRGAVYSAERPPSRKWLPGELYPHFAAGRVTMVALRGPEVGDLRGLSPHLVAGPGGR